MIGSPPGSVFSVLLPFGGIYQAPQRRRPGCLTLAEREEISRGLATGESSRSIGRRLGRPASTVSREVTKNKGPRRYHAVDADDRARRPQPCRLATTPVLRGYVAARLRDDWSPEQIAVGLRRRYPAGHRMRISHESIYKSVFTSSRGVLPKDLQKHLRTRWPIRRSVHNTVTGQWRSQIIGGPHIAAPQHR